MGIYIGMEMPTEGYIDVRIKCNGTASFAIAENPYIKAVEAVPVPAHGRLIDADAMEKVMSEGIAPSVKDGGFEHPFDIIRAVANAPTVIEAEEG